MPIIHLDNIWKAYGAHDVLSGITWQIDPGQRFGLVGHNGSGKTTLLGLLIGSDLPDRGQIHRQRGINMGYLSQEPTFTPGLTVFDVALEAFADLLHLQHRLHDMEQAMSNGQSSPEFLDEYGRLHDRYERQGGYALEAKTKAILFGLGFCDIDLPRPVEVLSGGQKNRLALAQLLAREPDLLLLDEPTNHLDLQALEWLEHFLSEYPKAFVVISHDRYFLDHTVTKIVELEKGQLQHYAGNYSFYVAEKELRRSQQQKTFEAQQTHITRTEEYIRRNIAGQKTKQAQSRRKALEKIERIERPDERRDMGLQFATASRGGDRVFQVEGLCKAYDQHILFENLDFTVWLGDRLGIVGPNGSGKSTLLKILVNQIAPDMGTVIPGKGLEMGYFEQTRQDLNPQYTVIEEIWALTPSATLTEIRTFLGAFLFSGDDVERRVGTLSGGEQSRLALAKLVRTPLNVLILDEPTNHLDIASRNVLEQALENFHGTLIAVSHDRYFLNRMVTRLLVLDTPTWYLIDGNYNTYQQQLTQEIEPVASKTQTSVKEDYTERKRNNREIERRKRRSAEVEKTIAECENEITCLDKEMARDDLSTDWNRLKELALKKAALQDQVETLMAEWETLEMDLSEIRTS